MARINAAACVTPINLVGLVLLATPRQSMGEADLVRQLELYASLLRQAPYSPRVWVTGADGALDDPATPSRCASSSVGHTSWATSSR